MNPIKLIASDLDGTLLTSHHTLSVMTSCNIRMAAESGVRIVLASGRPWTGIAPYIAELGLNQPGNFCISNNGALIHDAADGRIINAHTLSFNEYLEIEALAREIGVHCHAVTPDGMFTANRDISPYTVRESFLTNMSLEYCPIYEMDPGAVFSKVMLIDEPDVLTDALKNVPEEMKLRFTMVKSAPFFFEVLNARANKGNAVAWIAENLSIELSNVMCIGDHENDISMIKLAGLGVAMGNAVPNTLAAADVTTFDNDNDGVGEAIARYVLAESALVV